MLCENCKLYQANYHYKTSVNGEVKEVHLCSECVGKLGYGNLFGTSFDIGADSILSKFIGGGRYTSAAARCGACGAAADNLMETGRVGCAECYKTFSGILLPYIKKLQPGAVHTGRVPKSRGSHIATLREIKKLKTEQREAIDNQDFERAALLRDEIRRLEGSNAV